MLLARIGRCVHALWDATRAIWSAGKWRFHVVHRTVLHRDCAVQRERVGDCGDRRGPVDVACTTAQVQEHHHPQQHREIYRRVLDLRDRSRPLAFDLRERSRGDSTAQVRSYASVLFQSSFDFISFRSERLCLSTMKYQSNERFAI